jgi:hypothetical protein
MDTPKFENLQGAEAAKKIKELAEAARVGLMITNLADGHTEGGCKG